MFNVLEDHRQAKQFILKRVYQMDICQLFDLYGNQDTKKRQIAFILSKQPQITYNFNSILFFVYHYLDQYDYIQPDLKEIVQTENIKQKIEEFDDILPGLCDIQYKSIQNIQDPIYNSKEEALKTKGYIQHLLVELIKLQESDQSQQFEQNINSQVVYSQVKQQLLIIDSKNTLNINNTILQHFAQNMYSKLQIYDKPLFKDSFVQSLLLLQKCLGMAFQDRQYNYVYIDSFVFASQQKQRQIQNNLRILEKQNYSTYIFCPKCKQKKCIALGERQTTLGGDELTRIVYLCKECQHRFKR